MIFLGTDPDTGQGIQVADEDACLVCGMPRSGKSRGIVIPSVLAHHGPCLVTSSKWDVVAATIDVRAKDGPVWVFSLDGRIPSLPGITIQRCTWTPVPSCADFDTALLHARAMVGASLRGETRAEDEFWIHHAERLLAAALHAAALTNATLADVAAWILTGNLDTPIVALRAPGSGWPLSIVQTLARANERFRDSVLATAANVLRVYDHSYARAQAARPTLPIDDLLDHNGTLYVVSPAETQELMAPLVVGLVEDIVRRTSARADNGPRIPRTLLVALDEAARIAPLRGLPGWLAEAGSHDIQFLVVLQAFAQARDRWGPHAAEAFLTLFRHKVLLPGTLDRDLLQGLSQILGEDLWGTAPGAVTPRPRWSAHALASPSYGTAIHIDRAAASTLDLRFAP